MTLDQRALRDRLVLRQAAPGDDDAIAALTDAAFVAVGEESVERRLLRELAADGDLVPELTLVAEVDAELVGHVACSWGTIGEQPAIGLGPVSVRPDLQRRGIGGTLMSAVVATADQRGDAVVVLLGDPAYYGFFGFVPASTLGITSPGPWRDAYFQAKPLRAWRPEMAGAFRYAPAFERIEG